MARERIFDTESGNAVVVAMDPGTSSGAIRGLSDPRSTIKDILEANPDGAIMRPHFARHYQELFEDNDCDIILTADYIALSTKPGGNDGEEIYSGAFNPSFIKSMDPAGVKLLLQFGREDNNAHRRNVEFITRMSEELMDSDISLVVEPVMNGKQIPNKLHYDNGYIKNGCRIGWELGADILKVPYPKDKEAFRDIVNHSPVPISILGGASNRDIVPFLKNISDSVDVGARGVMVGRRIYQSENPAKVIKALKGIVHDQKLVEEVW